ncbi:ABC transporter ATP-binding protein [Candidatus Caldatribacterium sp.]|uniref:ABC transporter ATP-binding protein n=1 Tax=Candidatus Caldatribacterium sp. TaxID=2282143 RepID=UPI002998C911|nr:ATP-binding cassette domain-containing protein [Candidatus Caldatribacterium sp.]MDW8080939.1 ATP-binding cassette domain-containing protein [Candidatus Calescibacterium sp.]
MELLVTKDLTKRFGGLVAVNEVNLRIEENEALGIIGPNGSGKTTLFNLLSGFFTPTKGRVVFQGKDVTWLAPEDRVKMGMVRTFQLVSVFNSLKVWENLVPCVAWNSGMQRSLWKFMTTAAGDTWTDSLEALKLVGLENYAESVVAELSYGDRRLLEIALALSLKPKLLLLDEPFSGLSDVEIGKVLSLLRTLKGKITIGIIEHKISMIVDFVDRLCVMNEGRIICEGKPKDVLADPLVNECYWGKEEVVEAT